MSWGKFILLVEKNFTIQKRHVIGGLFEVLFPILLSVFLAYIRDQSDIVREREYHFEPMEFPPIDKCFAYEQSTTTIAYSPGMNSAIENLMRDALPPKVILQKFTNSQMLETFLLNQTENVHGVAFEDSLQFRTNLPKKLNYTIRLAERFIIGEIYPRVGLNARLYDDELKTTSSDYFGCFLAIQDAIETMFIKKQANVTMIQRTKLRKFAYPSVSYDPFLVNAIEHIFPIFVMFAFIYSTKVIIKNVAVERESQMKETMKIMGLTMLHHWLAWFAKCFLMLLIPIAFMVLILMTSIIGSPEKIVLQNSNPFLISVFFGVHVASLIFFCFLVSVLFKKSGTASTVGATVYILSYFPYMLVHEMFGKFGYFTKILYCLPLNTGMSHALFIILRLEIDGAGLQFGNFFTRSADMDFSFGENFLVMILTLILHASLLAYIDQVYPGEFGIPKKWYFPLNPCIRLCKGKKHKGYEDECNSVSDVGPDESTLYRDNYEEEPTNLKIGVQISSLSKNFGTKNVVKKLSLNMFESQITVLLGHNGAGKTTTMSMLTGLIPPTSGTAYIDGKDIRYSMDEARESLGLCPQHNVLFDELTVAEHFSFFCRLKGIEDKQEIANETNKYVAMLEMDDKRESLSRSLSGGMKRRLSVGIALCGNSRTVICDEPTSGMDSASRRALWDLLIEEKKNRTILLTTHHMDEADILGDRIAIMNDGELKTVGSSFFLKKKFGTGYKLICEKDDGCDARKLLEFLKEKIPDIRMENESQTEVQFLISEKYLSEFHGIFKALEDNLLQLGVKSFGCSLTTLEEVFLKIGSDAFNQKPKSDGFAVDDLDEIETVQSVVEFEPITPIQKVTGIDIWLYQIEAMIYKKFNYFRRNFSPYVWYMLISVILVYLFLADIHLEFEQEKSLDISLETYDGDTVTLLEAGRPKSSNSAKAEEFEKLVNSYKSLFKTKDSIKEIGNDSMDFTVLSIFNESFTKMSENYIIGATINLTRATAWFNPKFEHSLPLSVLQLHRGLLKHLAGENYDISLTNEPFEFRYNESTPEESKRLREMYRSPVTISVIVLFFFFASLWPAVFIAFYIKERDCRAKLMQFLCGANEIIFWIVSFLFDFVIFIVIIALLLAKIAIYQGRQFSTFEELSHFLLIFGFYGFGMLPFVYLFSFLFNKPSTGENLVPIVFIIGSVVWSFTNVFTHHKTFGTLATAFDSIAMLFPPYCFIAILKSLAGYLGEVASIDDSKISLYSFDEHTGIAAHLIYLYVSGILFIGLCIMIDLKLFQRICSAIFHKQERFPLRDNIDVDVQEEINHVMSMTDPDISNCNLVVRNLSKLYKNFLAVNQICLSVGSGECFGLLGINGAGKTTTFKMLTGDETISAGDVFVKGLSMKDKIHSVRKLIGYCPQYDALLTDLTGRETLVIFSLLRGIPKSDADLVIEKMSADLGLTKHLDKQVRAYSGGNKRKLSTALALMGDPVLSYLDEPTSGIDPGARRQLWNVVLKSKKSGCSIILTSHSMEECEALCTRIAILVSGQFKCLGSTQHLKNRFSKGFILTVKAGHDAVDSEDRMAAIKNEIKQLFPSIELKEQYLDILTYHIPDPDIKWSEVFGLMEQMKNVHNIDDYSLSQTSLEQVFLFFSKSGLHQTAPGVVGGN